jgi:chorismate mutase
MAVRALRGAITVDVDEPAEIHKRTADLLTVLFERNQLEPAAVISIYFTATKDLRSVAPAAAARAFGLVDVPLLCAQEMDVDGALERCVRLLVHVDTETPRHELRHVFLRGAARLRPELAEPGDEAL